LSVIAISAVCGAGLTSPVFAGSVVDVDLSGASTGAVVTGVGASFAETFAGQTVSGTGLSGSPTGPLSLSASSVIDVAYFNGANTLLPESDNQGPLAMLLDVNATSISWTMGYADETGPVSIAFFDSTGHLLETISETLTLGYNTYSFTPGGAFRGVEISNDNDPSGLRYYGFSYTASAAPEASTWAMLLVGFAGLGAAARRSRNARRTARVIA
jgi:hypothetical protein